MRLSQFWWSEFAVPGTREHILYSPGTCYCMHLRLNVMVLYVFTMMHLLQTFTRCSLCFNTAMHILHDNITYNFGPNMDSVLLQYPCCPLFDLLACTLQLLNCTYYTLQDSTHTITENINRTYNLYGCNVYSTATTLIKC